MTSKLAVSAKMLACGAAVLALSSGMALAQSAAPACIGSQNTDCVPSGGVNGTTGTQNPNGVLMTPGETPNGLRTTPGTNGMTTGTGPGIGTTGSGVGSTTSPAPSTGTGMGMGATPGVGGGASGGASGGTAK
jgi:hypothetical protein